MNTTTWVHCNVFVRNGGPIVIPNCATLKLIMFGSVENITTVLLLQNAISIILDKIGVEINSHATCIITDGNSSFNNEVHLNHLPAVRGDCQTGDENVFINQVQHGVTIGCSFFVVDEGCALRFLDNFHRIHDWVDQKYEKKVLVVIDTQRALPYSNVMDILRHRIVINDLPITLLLQPNVHNEWICVWSAYPYDLYFLTHNRFFLRNLSFEYDQQIIPKLTDLNGLIVTGAFLNYPPYTSHERVAIGTGNAQLFNSNESLPIYLDGQEQIILLEFCKKYNCTLTARLEYDEELWGDVYDNQTGNGMIGATATREANLTVAAMYLWEEPYKFTQYSTIIQSATATMIVPKPLPLPYWKTPILPFPDHIWSYVLSVFLICALVLFIVNAMETRFSNNIRGNRGHDTLGLFDSIFAVLRVSLFQGVRINNNYLSNIVIFTSLLNFALIIGNLYCGGLSSVMTIIRYESPIDSVESLVKSNFPWGGSTCAWMDAILQSDYPPHKILINKYITKSLPELHQLIQQHTMAITLERMQHGTLSYQDFIDKESSKYYTTMKHPIYAQFTIVISGKTWPFMEQLNRIVLMQQESGIRYYWEYLSARRLMDYDIQRNLEENGKAPQAGAPVRLSVKHILGALFLLLIGNALAALIFLLEMLNNYLSGNSI